MHTFFKCTLNQFFQMGFYKWRQFVPFCDGLFPFYDSCVVLRKTGKSFYSDIYRAYLTSVTSESQPMPKLLLRKSHVCKQGPAFSISFLPRWRKALEHILYRNIYPSPFRICLGDVWNGLGFSAANPFGQNIKPATRARVQCREAGTREKTILIVQHTHSPFLHYSYIYSLLIYIFCSLQKNDTYFFLVRIAPPVLVTAEVQFWPDVIFHIEKKTQKDGDGGVFNAVFGQRSIWTGRCCGVCSSWPFVDVRDERLLRTWLILPFYGIYIFFWKHVITLPVSLPTFLYIVHHNINYSLHSTHTWSYF